MSENIKNYIHNYDCHGSFNDIPFSKLCCIDEFVLNMFRIEYTPPKETRLCFTFLNGTSHTEYIMYNNVKYNSTELLRLKMALENEYNLKCIENLS